MAGSIKGITVQIGGDATGLDKALKGVNSQAKAAQNELKEVNKALKLDPGNTELLEQKQRALAAAVAATAEKLDTLKEAQKQAAEQLARGDIGQEQYDALTREIVKAEAELKKAKQEADNFSVGLEKAKTSLDKVGSAAAEVSQKTAGLSAAAGGLITAIGALAYKTAQSADELNTLSAQTGISTDDLQKMAYAADLVDVSVDNITGSMAKMKKQMASGDSGAEIFSKLGVSVRDSSGEMRDATEVYFEVLDALSQVGNETERDQLAMEVFGKSADQLAGIIDDGGQKLKDLGKEAEDLGLILDEQTLESLNEVNDTIDKLKAQASAELAKAGAEALEALTPLLEKVIEKLGELFEWIGSLDESQMQTILTVAAVIAAISPVAGIISTICSAISGFLAIWPGVQAAGAAIKAFAAANPVGLIVTAIAVLAGIIIANWDKIRPVLEAVWAKVKDVFDKVHDKITTVTDKIKEVFESVKETVSSIWDGIIGTIKGAINSVFELINKLSAKVNFVGEKINNSGLAKFLGIQIPTIQAIPLLASGGTLSSGSAIVGEAGPELLTMSNGAANVTPIQNTTNTYNTINNTSQRPIEITLVADGLKLAKAVYKPLQQVAQQMGPSLGV